VGFGGTQSSDGKTEVFCAHCGLPVPPSLVTIDGSPSFCCSGCKTVYGVIRSAGFDEFYALKAIDDDRLDAPANPKLASFGEFDEPDFVRMHTREGEGARRIDLYLEGVHCAACVWLVEKLPEMVEGVISVRLDFGRSVATVLYDPQAVELSRVARALDRIGYTPHPFRSSERRALARKEERKLLIRLGVAGAAAGNVMLLAIALYAGAGEDPAVAQLFRWISLLITVPTVLWSGRTFFNGALAGLRAKTLHMDLPVSLAILGATASSAVHTAMGQGHVYFDSVAMLMFLLLAARWAQVRALRSASDASELLFSLAPSKARLVDEDETSRDVPVESIVLGQRVEVRAGESIPVDGVVEQGLSRVDNALLTGESVPVEVGAGAEVHAGANNVSARLVVRVTATGEHTRVGRLLAAVEEAQRRKAPIVRLADRVASYFVLAVLLLSGVTAAVWWGEGSQIVVERVVAMLVVTCPCALGLATPLALINALGAAARNGIFVKGPDTVEALAHIRHVMLDKTGTLTQGRVALTTFDGDAGLLESVAALEAQSSHLIARAVEEATPPGVAGRHDVRDVAEVAGAGLRGTVDGKPLVLGTAAFLRASGVDVSSTWESRMAQVAGRGETPVLVASDGHVAALAAFGDPLREDSQEAVGALGRLGLSLGILSGDHPRVVQHVARALSIDGAVAHGGVGPELKLATVEKMTVEGRQTAMIGDGVNDAGALAAARVGIAVRGGAEVSLATADVFLTRPGLMPAVDLIRGCRATLRVVYRNLGISLIYNAVGATLAVAGFINPLVAAVLMPLSSLTVVLSSALARPFPRPPSAAPAKRPVTRKQEVPA
jgi:P-type Cu2+ transporter